MPVAEIVVRCPVPADGPSIGRVWVQAWQRAYAGLMPDEFLAQLDEVERGEAWHQRLVARERGLADDPEGVELLVAELVGAELRPGPVGGQASAGATGSAPDLVGVATIGPDRDDPAGGRGELWMINVRPDAWGSGAGPALLTAAVDRLGHGGYKSAVLWVVAGNDRARRFYQREGWQPDGGRKEEEFGGQVVVEHRYRRPVG